MEKEIKLCNQWHTLPSEVMAKQMTTQHSSNSLSICSYCSLDLAQLSPEPNNSHMPLCCTQ